MAKKNIPAEKILQQIVDDLEKAGLSFDDVLPGLQQDLYDLITDMTRGLDTSDGKIKMTTANLKKIQVVEKAVLKRLLSAKYKNGVKDVALTFAHISALQDQYFKALDKSFKPGLRLEQLRKASMTLTVNSLTDSGITSAVTRGIKDLLTTAIRAGGSIKDLEKQLSTFIKGGKDAKGNPIPSRLQSYVGQITTDGLNQFSANYNALASASLGYEWFMYTGSLLATSRAWCVHMVKKKYIHISEFDTVIFDNVDGVVICGEDIPCYKGLPKGMIPGTNAGNLKSRRGGYRCGHQLGGIPEELVPALIKAKIAK